MTHASLFSGIGGPEVAAAMMGWDNIFHCEINPFGRRVLGYWFPESVCYEDITKTDFSQWRGQIDVLTGGFPCQPFSYAGKRGGQEDERYLWPEMCRAIQEIRPTWVVGENVAGITTMVEGGVLTPMGCETSIFNEGDDIYMYRLLQSFTIERICKDFESLGYEVQPMLIPAAACGAPHRRDRIFILAHASNSNNDSKMRVSGEYEGACGKEGVSERDKVQLTGEPSDVRPEDEELASYANGRGSREVPTEIHPGLPDGAKSLGDGCKRHTADPDCPRLQEPEQPGRAEDSEKEGGRVHDRAIRPGEYGPVTHAFCQRLSAAIQSGVYGSQERDDAGRSAELSSYDAWAKGTWWDKFPTVSPVHSGNDGLPIRMDGITIPFGKWRTESLKAYGNAIVPQVMFRIFQAIEQVTKQASL